MWQGMPLEWIDYREAVRLYHAEQVAYDCGTLLYTVFGGISSLTRPAKQDRGQLDRRDPRYEPEPVEEPATSTSLH